MSFSCVNSVKLGIYENLDIYIYVLKVEYGNLRYGLFICPNSFNLWLFVFRADVVSLWVRVNWSCSWSWGGHRTIGIKLQNLRSNCWCGHRAAFYLGICSHRKCILSTNVLQGGCQKACLRQIFPLSCWLAEGKCPNLSARCDYDHLRNSYHVYETM